MNKKIIMKNLFIILIALYSWQGNAQVSNTFYGLARKNTPANEIFLATVNPTTGVVTNVSPSSLSPIVNLTGAALDPYNNHYHFIGYNEIKTINLTTGLQTNSAVISNPIAASYFDNFRFNHSDSTLYGLARRYIYDSVTMTGYGEVFLATINTTTGVITQISTNSVGQGYALAGSAIDPYQKVFYYSTGANLVGLDMYNGSIYSNVPIQLPPDNYFDNFTYSCADTALYGLIRTNYFDSIPDPIDTTMYIQILDSTAIHLGKINPNTGVVTVISPVSIAQGGYTLNAGSTIDPSTMVYYYNNGSQLVGVSLITGLVVSQPNLTNPTGQFFELMRIQSNCYEAKQPIRLNSATVTADIRQSNDLLIHPNPSHDWVKIESREDLDKIDIINPFGKVLRSIRVQGKLINIDISPLPQGVYVVKAYGKNKIATAKLVKE